VRTVHSIDWTTPAIRIAAAGFGAAVAGPLGAALGGLLGDALGSSATGLIKGYAEKFGEKAADKFLDSGADSLIETLKTPSPQIEAVYRESLRLSLATIREQMGGDYEEWFSNWDSVLAAPESLDLSSIHLDRSAADRFDDLFRLALERLDAQAAAIRRKDLSLTLQTRQMSDELVSELGVRLPLPLQENFRELIVTPRYESAWKQAQLVFQQFTDLVLGRIDETTLRIERKVDRLVEKSSSTTEVDDDKGWVVKIDEDRHLAQSDEQIALIFDEMRVAASLPNRFRIEVNKQAMVNAIRVSVVLGAVHDFGKLYNSITSSLELATLVSKPESQAGVSVEERMLRVDARKLARLWEPIEDGLNRGIRCFRDAIHKHDWLQTPAQAAEATRSFVDMYFDSYLWRDKPLSGTKIDVWRDREPRMQASIRLTKEEIAELEATLGGTVYPYLLIKDSGFTAGEFSISVVRRKFAPRIVCEAISVEIPVHEPATSDQLFELGSWNIGLG